MTYSVLFHGTTPHFFTARVEEFGSDDEDRYYAYYPMHPMPQGTNAALELPTNLIPKVEWNK